MSLRLIKSKAFSEAWMSVKQDVDQMERGGFAIIVARAGL
jgi:hypothetical protein